MRIGSSRLGWGGRRLAGLMALCVLTACSDDAAEVRRWVDEQQRTAAAPAASAPAMPVFTPLAYRPLAQIDPFEANRLEPPTLTGLEGRGVDARASLPVLERLPLEAMTLVGVIDRGGQRLALLLVEGALQTVRPGERLGLQGGTVQDVSERALTVSEPVRDALGRSSRRISTLTLKEVKP